jgi:hypothetical protein
MACLTLLTVALPGPGLRGQAMTDARFPERWLNDRRIMRLHSEAFRLFIVSLAWSVANRTDGVLYDDDLELLPGLDAGWAHCLVKAGLWERVSDYWLITVFEATQTTAAELASLDIGRRIERDRGRRRRAHDRGDHSLCGDRPCAVQVDVQVESRRTGQARTGRALRESRKPS